MRVNIISYEALDGWICGKIAQKLYDWCKLNGLDVVLSNKFNADCDINHHIIYTGYNNEKNGINTVYITHIDNSKKLEKLHSNIVYADMGICMSAYTRDYLINFGFPKSKLTYINLSHDSNAIERTFTIGITTRLYPDGRKNEYMIEKLIPFISPKDFDFKIMGFGWQSIVKKLKDKGFKVEYHQDFNYEAYLELMSSLDYFLYTGEDEGSVGFIDALASGVKTIVQPQGHHLDALNGITFPFTNFEELKNIFKQIENEKFVLTSAVKDWTWNMFAQKHIFVWKNLYQNKLNNSSEEVTFKLKRFNKGYLKLFFNFFVQRVTLVTNLNKVYESGSRYFQPKKK